MKAQTLLAVKSFWRGNFSPIVSFWAVGTLVIALQYSLASLASWVVSNLGSLWSTLVVLLIYLAFLISTCILWWIGSWRSVSKPPAFYSAVKKVAISFVVLGYSIPLTASTLLQISEAISALREDPQWGARSVRTAASGSEIIVSGYITRSVTKTFVEELRAFPNIRTVRLDSSGGRIGPAFEMASIIRSSHLDTLVTTKCISACTMAFLAGKNRWITESGKLGFHAPSFGGQIIEDASNVFRTNALASGIARPFIERSLKDQVIWYPTFDELSSSRAITGIKRADSRAEDDSAN